MTDTPLEPPPLPTPATLEELNAKVDLILENGRKTFIAAQTLAAQKAKRRDRMMWAVGAVAVLSLATSGSMVKVIHDRCVDRNEDYNKQVQLWEGIIALTANNPSLQTPEERAAQTKGFRRILGGTFPQRDCWWW